MSALGRKKGFFSIAITFFVTKETKEILNTIPNASEFIRSAINEKIARENIKTKEV